MATFLFRCPNTGFGVQDWVADDGAEDADDTYEAVICHGATAARLTRIMHDDNNFVATVA